MTFGVFVFVMKVEFQVLQITELNKLLDVIVEYVLKQYNSINKIAILAPANISKDLDDRLWQQGNDSFIAHYCAINSRDYSKYKNIPILITDNLFITSGFDVLINIMDVAVDPQKVKLKELKEFVYQDDNALQASRKKYIYYNKLGLDIKTIKDVD